MEIKDGDGVSAMRVTGTVVKFALGLGCFWGCMGLRREGRREEG